MKHYYNNLKPTLFLMGFLKFIEFLWKEHFFFFFKSMSDTQDRVVHILHQ